MKEGQSKCPDCGKEMVDISTNNKPKRFECHNPKCKVIEVKFDRYGRGRIKRGVG